MKRHIAAMLLAVASIALSVYCIALDRAALACARASVASFEGGTDQDLADCYTTRGLPVPADL